MSKIVVLTGESGAGKTRLCEHVFTLCSERGVAVAGILSPPRFVSDAKIGIDVVDIRSGERRPLAELESDGCGPSVGRWHFHAKALEWGAQIIEQAFPCALLIVDELGPLELERHGGWANGIDLLRQESLRAMVVVRPNLLEKLRMHLEGLPLVTLEVTRDNHDDLLSQLASFARVAP